jgi:hypothetical protein
MKINRLETHDRLLEFGKQADYISQGCQDCINRRPPEFENYPFYIFAHKRELGLDERFKLFSSGIYKALQDVPTHRMIWGPRLTKPEAQINSMLFRHYPAEDIIKVIWMITEPATWGESEEGKMLENNVVSDSIHLFRTDKKKLEAKEPDDLPESKVKEIYRKIAANQKLKLPTSGAFPSASSTPDYNPQS